MRTTIRKMHDGFGIIIPQIMLDQIGATIGIDLDLALTDGEIRLRPVIKQLRQNWAEATERIAGENHISAWQEFGNADDDQLDW